MFTSWEVANINRKSNITNKHKENGKTYFSPYIDAGLWEGNDLASITNQVSQFDHLTLSFIQQVNQHNDRIDMSVAGIPKGDDGYRYWEEHQFWGKSIKPMYESGNFENIKVAYGGATTGGMVDKNPWDLALRLSGVDRGQKASKSQINKASILLEEALIGYQKEIQSIPVKYGKANINDVKIPKSIDFDIEGHAQQQPEELEVLAKTLARMKKQDPTWDFSLTLPVLPTGLTNVGYGVLDIFVKEFAKEGLSPTSIPVVNLMLMDYGDPIYKTAQNQGLTNFDLAKQALEATHRNIRTAIDANYKANTALSDNQIFGLLGATPMIGVNDHVWGVFTLEDAKELYNYAQDQGLAYIGMWSLNDDRGRQNGKPVGKTLVTHGLVYLEEYDFIRAFSGHWTEQVKNPRREWKR